ncbi:MAG: hypothetical protein ACXV3F_11555 [Frankiaceae bacterium]
MFDHLSSAARRRLAVGFVGLAAVPLLLAGCSNANPKDRTDTVPSPVPSLPAGESPAPAPIVAVPGPGIGGPDVNFDDIPGTQYPRGHKPTVSPAP